MADGELIFTTENADDPIVKKFRENIDSYEIKSITAQFKNDSNRTISLGAPTYAGAFSVGSFQGSIITNIDAVEDYSAYRQYLRNKNTSPKRPGILNINGNIIPTMDFSTLLDRMFACTKATDNDLSLPYGALVFTFEASPSDGVVEEDADDIARELCRLIQNRKHQIVLHGAPGTGKTYTARKIADYFISGKDPGKEEANPDNQLYYDYCIGKAPKNLDEDTLRDRRKILREIVADQELRAKGEIVEQLKKGKFKDSPAWEDGWPANTDDIEAMRGRVKLVQFHPSYDYTDFVEGLRPVEVKTDDEKTGVPFHRMDGSFMRFCRYVAWRNERDGDDTKKYFFIIDEINRADLSKVLGELMFSLEEDKRGEPIETQYSNLETWFEDDLRDRLKPIPLPETPSGDTPEEQKKFEEDPLNYEQKNKEQDDLRNVFKTEKLDYYYSCFGKDKFFIPPNVVIIGTMNDIDRSVESMDFAMRRRFVWKKIRVSKKLLYQALSSGMLDDALDGVTDAPKLIGDIVDGVVSFNKALHEVHADFRSGDYDIAQGQFSNIQKNDLADNEGKAVNAAEGTRTKAIMDWVWAYRVQSLVAEYLRGRTEGAAELNMLRDAFKPIFASDMAGALNGDPAILSLNKAFRVRQGSSGFAVTIADRIGSFNTELYKLPSVDFELTEEYFFGLVKREADSDDDNYASEVKKTLGITKDTVQAAADDVCRYVWDKRIDWPLTLALQRAEVGDIDGKKADLKAVLIPSDQP